MTTIPATTVTTGLVIEDLSVRIPLPGRQRRYVHAAEQLDLTLHPGRITAVVGESGCGKSVLGQAITGLLPAGTLTDGRIRMGDLDLLSADEDALRRVRGTGVAIIPQSAATHLTPVRTVGSLMAETLRRHEIQASIAALLDEVHLGPEVATRYPHELSGGMAQRVLVALILALEPQVLIADEPTSALDPDTTRLVLAALRARAERGAAVMLITHDLPSARDVADDVAVMYAGRLLEVGPFEKVLTRPAHDYTRALLAALPENGFHVPPGTPSSLVDPPEGICAWHQRAGTDCPATGLRPVDDDHRVACR